MKVSELIQHLNNIRGQYGDIEVRVDTDIFRDSLPRDVSSLRVEEYFVRGIGDVVIGYFPSEQTHRVVMYVGNEPVFNLQGV